MSSIPVLKSKLTMPELSDSFMMTERIRKLHQKMDSSRAVTISAPAGYGKTSLAVSYFQYLSANPFRICWYRLDPEDSNSAVFAAHLMEVLFPSGNKEFAESRKTLEDTSDVQLELYSVASMICHEMWAAQLKQESMRTYIVLDDFQNVAEVQEICNMVRYLLDNLPTGCSIFLLNRINAPVFTEKQKLERKILEITEDDLAFSNNEIDDLVLGMVQSAGTKELTDFIQKRTEGWIAGIIILCQAVKNSSSRTEPFELAKMDHEDTLFRYLSVEVFRSVDDRIQNDLARLALLQDFSEVEASKIFEIQDIRLLMKKCLDFGMFIQKIPGTPIVYRFHSLFREFLLTILKSHYTEEKIAEFHTRAAKYYIENTAYIRAAEHITKCGRSESAMNMVTYVGFNKFLVGETAQLKLWLDLFPENMIMENPVLLMFKAQLMPNSRQHEIVEPLKRILEKSRAENKPEIYFNVSTILIYIFMISNNMDGLVEMSTDLEWMYQNVSEEHRNTFSMLDLVRFIGQEQFVRAEVQSESIISGRMPEESRWLYFIVSCINYYCLGKLDQAERCMKNALQLENYKHIEPAKGFILLFLTQVLVLKNEKSHIPAYISRIFAIGEKYNYEYLSANAKRLAAYERYLSFDAGGAAEMLDYAAFYYRQMNNRVMAAVCELLRCLWTLRYNNPFSDLNGVRKYFELIRKSRPGMAVVETSLSILGAIAREAGDYDLAEECLMSSMNAASEKNEYQALCGSLFHLAKLYFDRNDPVQGRQFLKQAMKLASENRYFMFWDIHIPTLVEMALRSIRYNYCPGFAERLLSMFYSGKTVMYLSERVKSMDECRIAAFIGEFVNTCRAGRDEQLYLVRASLFGIPEISVNGVKIPDTEWKTKKVKNFLEYLLLNNGNTISKEMLAEMLWPGADSKSALASQRTALYYLRKVLSKYHVEVTGSNAFIYETLEGLQIRNNDVLELDIQEFLRIHNELPDYDGKTPEEDQKKAELLKKMISLYKGDLMEGNDYGDLVFYERERFRSIFVEACLELSEIEIRLGKVRQAGEILRKAMAVEPYNENICLELIRLYMSQGRKSMAVKLYYSFKKRLEQELNIQIDQRLTDAIRNSS